MLTYPAVILQWFVDAASAEAAVCHKNIIEVEIRPEKVTPACLEPQVCVDVCRKYFTKDAWLVVKDVISIIKRDPKWYCGRCSKQNDDIESSTVVCYGFILNALVSTQNQSIKFGFVHVV